MQTKHSFCANAVQIAFMLPERVAQTEAVIERIQVAAGALTKIENSDQFFWEDQGVSWFDICWHLAANVVPDATACFSQAALVEQLNNKLAEARVGLKEHVVPVIWVMEGELRIKSHCDNPADIPLRHVGPPEVGAYRADSLCYRTPATRHSFRDEE